VTWFTTRVGAYGPLPGIQAQTLTDVSQVAAATAWRSRRIDPTGFYWLGARYYEPTSGRFLSADPMGHAASPSLYDYAGGDPVNRTDPDGRCASKLAQFMSDPIGNADLLNDIYKDVQAINDFNRQDIFDQANAIKQKIADFINNNPGATVPISADDFNTLELANAYRIQDKDVEDMSWDRVAKTALTADGVFRYIAHAHECLIRSH
jgi:RHS repeat-associated protein